MASLADALKYVIENTPVLDVEEKSVFSAAGQVAAEDVFSDIILPQRDIAGPDGYALRSADIKDASRENPAVLDIIGAARAGRMSTRKVKPGTAMRIMTGAVVPEGADRVIRFEDTDEPGDKNGPNRDNPTKVKIFVAASPGPSIRPAGWNVKKGDLVLPKGTLLGPSQLSALASIGKTTIKVFRRPVVAIIVTGDELVRSGKSLAPDQCYDSNTATIASLVAHYGGIPKILGIARDKEESLRSKFQKGMLADAIITSGGVSRGDYDMVRLVIGSLGKVIFSRLDMGPGASFALGVIHQEDGAKSIPVYSLSGPPSGCLINFQTLVRSALLKMRGLTEIEHPTVEATALDAFPKKMSRPFAVFSDLQKTSDGYRVDLNLMNRVNGLASMTLANSLTIIPANSDIRPGDKIEVLPLDWCGK